MRILIDGYNLAHASTWLALGGRVRKAEGLRMMMTRILCRYAERTRDRVTVVFDGLPADHQQVESVGRRAGVEVVFSGPNEDADTLIERLLEVDTGARDILVVSSDRRVRAAASRHRAKSCSAGEFFNRIRNALTKPPDTSSEEPPEKFTGLDEVDTSLWIRILNLEETEAPDREEE